MTPREARQAAGRRIVRKQARKALRWMKAQPKKTIRK